MNYVLYKYLQKSNLTASFLGHNGSLLGLQQLAEIIQSIS